MELYDESAASGHVVDLTAEAPGGDDFTLKIKENIDKAFCAYNKLKLFCFVYRSPLLIGVSSSMALILTQIVKVDAAVAVKLGMLF